MTLIFSEFDARCSYKVGSYEKRAYFDRGHGQAEAPSASVS